MTATDSLTTESEVRRDLRELIDRVCRDHPDAYWRELEETHSYPEAFVDALTGTGVLGALIPEEYGGLGLGLGDATVIVEQINRDPAMRTCKSCGHLNAPFPTQYWGWADYRRRTHVVVQARKTMIEAAAKTAAPAPVA